MKLEKPKANTFVIRGLHLMQVVERMFCIETPEERYRNHAHNTLELIPASGIVTRILIITLIFG